MEEILNFEVKGNSYKITFPTVGQFMQIESLKQTLSNGMYEQLIKTNTNQAQNAANMIDIEATLSILSPDLIKSFGDLSIKNYNVLKEAYIEQFLPWWNKLLKELNIY